MFLKPESGAVGRNSQGPYWARKVQYRLPGRKSAQSVANSESGIGGFDSFASDEFALSYELDPASDVDLNGAADGFGAQ